MDNECTSQGLWGPLTPRIHILWTKKHSPLHRKLSFNIIREICSYIGDVQQLMAVRQGRVMCFYTATSQWQQFLTFSHSIDVNDATSSTFIAPGTIIACGGGEYPCTCDAANRAYMLKGNGCVKNLRHMISSRNYPGVAWDSGRKALYVFGGTSGSIGTCYTVSMRTCEMFLSNKWSHLPDMHKCRRWFNTCWHSYLIYLCGGLGTKTVETYDPRSNTFTLQDFILPEDSPTTAIVECNVLTVISQRHISKLQQGRLTSQQHECYQPCSNFTPGVSGGAIYIVDLNNECCRSIDLTTGAVQKEVRLD